MSEEPEINIAMTRAYRLALFETHLHKIIEDVDFLLSSKEYPGENWGDLLTDLRSRCKILSDKWDDMLKSTVV